ncbi:GspH/FimT family pseudopilin [Marinobacter sp. S6332]|uniref:GspH/FimT family pseudopilin n=1 Tax=Marinobacter sp. S6332 TaxID=2926403 RepID=UPI001FF25BA2|nr:GspH/FimT family pseudopilin [Marinobacter sp. S6332]MCK0165004.1 GspH/FimT family pseudopilin [Marinobacter sp. S6332]
MRTRINSGFTLIELLVTIAVLAIMMALAAPSFVNMIENSRVTTQANTLLAAVNLARSEAVKQGTPFSIQNEPGGFVNGWCVIDGGLGVNDCDTGTIIKRFPALEGVSVSQGGVAGVTFDGRGYKIAPNAVVNIELEPPTCTSGSARMRRVSISMAGRATVTLEDCS